MQNNIRIMSGINLSNTNISRITSGDNSNKLKITNEINSYNFDTSRITSGTNSYVHKQSGDENKVPNYTTKNINFQKIYTNKYDALNGSNSVKISDSTKKIWLNGETTFKTNEDGSVLISVNGVPYGWTTKEILDQNNNATRITSGHNSYTPNESRITSGYNSYTPNESRIISGYNSYTSNEPRITSGYNSYNQNIAILNENDSKKSIGATAVTLGASVTEGAAELAEKGLHGLAAMGSAIATPFTGAYDAVTGNNTTGKMWNSVGDLMMENKVKDSWDSVYNNEISELKDKTYGFDTTRAVGNAGGEVLVGAALSGGLSAVKSAATTSTELSNVGTTTARSTASAAQNTARIEAASSSASSIVGNSGTAYSSPEEILSAVRKGDLAAQTAKKYIKSHFTNITDGGNVHSILAELSNLSKAA